MGELRQEFLKQTISNLETLQDEFFNSSFSEDFLRRCFRSLHTIKGTSNTFNLFYLGKIAHKIESLVQGVLDNQIPQNEETESIFQESFTQILQTAQNYHLEKEISFPANFISKLETLIPDKANSNDLLIFQIPPRILSKLSMQEKNALNLAIQKGKIFYLLKANFTFPAFYEDFKNLKEKLNNNGEVVAVSSNTNKNPNQEVNFQVFFTTNLLKPELEKLITNFSVQIEFENTSPTLNLPENLSELLENLVNYGKKTAQFLNKNIAFESEFADAKISNGHLILLNEVASHLLHNAIDHAIEPVEKRALHGKNPTAKIKIKLKKLEGEFLFEIEDDGGGIDVEKITQIAKQKGLISNNKISTETKVLELIFSQGFSTSETISEISGRGVGLDAVKDLVEKSNGRIEVETKDGFGTKFSVYLPNN